MEVTRGQRGAAAAESREAPLPIVLRRLRALPAAALARLTLVQRFMIVTLLIVVVGAFVIGTYVAGEIKSRVIHRTSAITALYVESFVSPHLQELASGQGISEPHFAHLDELLASTSLGQKIVSFKVWDREGRVLYAGDRRLVGQQFAVGPGLEAALQGKIHSGISELTEEENRYERGSWDRLLETYAPVHAYESGEIIAVSEFYQDPAELEGEIRSSQRRGWLIVGVATLVMYLLLVGMVKGASTTIFRQQARLGHLARENAALAARVRGAADRKSETDEQLLARVAQDLHDGPAQEISVALLRLEAAAKVREGSPIPEGELGFIHTALAAALREVRQISTGLRLPELKDLSAGAVVEKAAEDHRRRTGDQVRVQAPAALPQVSLPVKIALYRVTQESLNNAHLHAGVTEGEVTLAVEGAALRLEVRDRGVGLGGSGGERGASPERLPLGLRGMRERVELLGGMLEVSSPPGGGTLVRALIPVVTEAPGDG